MLPNLSDIIVLRYAVVASPTDNLGIQSCNVAITDPTPYDIDDIDHYSVGESPSHQHCGETCVLLRRSSTPVAEETNSEQSESLPALRFEKFPPSSATDFETHGWVRYTGPGNIYFHHSALCVTTDANLWDPDKLSAVMTLLNKLGSEVVLPMDQWELWLRDDEMSKHESVPSQAWVHHTAQTVSFDQYPPNCNGIQMPGDQS